MLLGAVCPPPILLPLVQGPTHVGDSSLSSRSHFEQVRAQMDFDHSKAQGLVGGVPTRYLEGWEYYGGHWCPTGGEYSLYIDCSGDNENSANTHNHS